MDRWIAAVGAGALRRAGEVPVVVDLGFGAAPWTAVELLGRLRAVRGDVEVVGVEIDAGRVERARELSGDVAGLSFRRGGFEVPLEGGVRPLIVRAANVLRQYEADEVAGVWERMCGRLAPGGLLVEGTCDELGRRHAWVTLGPEGPRTLTLAARAAGLERPSELAERLPKALIHRNVPGEPVHGFLADLDRAWASTAPFAAFGARQRWVETVRTVGVDWPLRGPRGRAREGEVTVAWEAVAPGGLTLGRGAGDN